MSSTLFTDKSTLIIVTFHNFLLYLSTYLSENKLLFLSLINKANAHTHMFRIFFLLPFIGLVTGLQYFSFSFKMRMKDFIQFFEIKIIRRKLVLGCLLVLSFRHGKNYACFFLLKEFVKLDSNRGAQTTYIVW